jgi:hypothetical protein
LNPIFIYEWCIGDIIDVTESVFEGFYQEGITDALERLHRSRRFLRSKSLAVSLSFTILTLVISTLTIFGINDTTIAESKILILLNLIVLGFIVSIILTALSVRGMFSLGR